RIRLDVVEDAVGQPRAQRRHHLEPAVEPAPGSRIGRTNASLVRQERSTGAEISHREVGRALEVAGLLERRELGRTELARPFGTLRDRADHELRARLLREFDATEPAHRLQGQALGYLQWRQTPTASRTTPARQASRHEQPEQR